MTQSEFICDVSLQGIAQAPRNGGTEHAFTQLADCLRSDGLTLSDDVLRRYLRDELIIKA